MHKSRFAGFIIDCETEDLETAATFWTQALGYKPRDSVHPDDSNYIPLDTGPNDPAIELQRVSHPSRVHIDIETDNVEAEVTRLEKLGAKRVQQVKSWWVMEAPSGHRFCVIVAQKPGFEQKANQWD